MKLIPVGVLLAAIMMAGSGRAEIIDARVEQMGGDTLIYCTTDDDMEIERAIFTLFKSDGSMRAVLTEEMEVTNDNVATIILSGRHRHLDGKCRLFLAGGDNQSRERFSLSMLFYE